MKRVFIVLFFAILISQVSRGNSEFLFLPPAAEKTSPEEIGKKLAENLSTTSPRFSYVEACWWYGALEFAHATHNESLCSRLIQRFDPFLKEFSVGKLKTRPNVDDNSFGIVPLEIYLISKEPKYLEVGKLFADKQWENISPDGMTKEARYWSDDVYMFITLQVLAYRTTGDVKYLNRAVKVADVYIDRLQSPSGLFIHAPDAPYFWSRGNGWVSVGLTELLLSLPEDHASRPKILKSYRKLMVSLIKFQNKDGSWNQLIDHPEAWSEMSGTAMFVAAMTRGVNQGWLESHTFRNPIEKTWQSLVNHLDENMHLTNVCVGTGRGKSVDYYLKRKHGTDSHGFAPILWAAKEFIHS